MVLILLIMVFHSRGTFGHVRVGRRHRACQPQSWCSCSRMTFELEESFAASARDGGSRIRISWQPLEGTRVAECFFCMIIELVGFSIGVLVRGTV